MRPHAIVALALATTFVPPPRLAEEAEPAVVSRVWTRDAPRLNEPVTNHGAKLHWWEIAADASGPAPRSKRRSLVVRVPSTTRPTATRTLVCDGQL